MKALFSFIVAAGTSLLLLSCASSKKDETPTPVAESADTWTFPVETREPAAVVVPLEKITARSRTISYNPRTPEPKTSPIKTKACGFLYGTDDSRTTVSNDEQFYLLDIDCGGSKKITVARLDFSTLKRGRLSYIPRWRRAAYEMGAQLTREGKYRGSLRDIVPYLCFRGEVTRPLCSGENTTVVTRIDQMTGSLKEYISWQ